MRIKHWDIRRHIAIAGVVFMISLLTIGTISVMGATSETVSTDIQIENTTLTPGESVTVSYDVTNTGESNKSIILDSELPPSWTSSNQSDDGGVYKSTNQTWLWQTVDPGETKSPTLTVTVPEDAASDTYTITGTTKLETGIVNTSSQFIEVDGDNPAPEDSASVSTQIEKSTVTPGEQFAVSYEIINTGENDTGLILDAELPSEWTIVDRSDDDGEYKASDQTWLWKNAAPDEPKSPTLTVMVPEDARIGEYSIAGQAKLSSGVADNSNQSISVDKNANFEITVDKVDSQVTEGETATINTTIENTGGVTGTQDIIFNKTGAGTDDSAVEPDVELAPGETTTANFSTDNTATAGSIDLEVASNDDSASRTVTVNTPAVVNQSASSVTPTTVTAKSDQEFEVNVTIDNIALPSGDENGQIDVKFEAFDLQVDDDDDASGGGDDSSGSGDNTDTEDIASPSGSTVTAASNAADLTIEFNESAITDDTLTVSETVTATAPEPTTERKYKVNVTDVRTDPSNEYLIEDAAVPIDQISVEPKKELNLTANRTTIEVGQSIEFNLTDLSGEPLIGNLSVEGEDEIIQTTADGTAVRKFTDPGTLRVEATKANNKYKPDTKFITIEPPKLELQSTDPVTFGEVPLSKSETENVTVENTGSVPINLTSARITTPSTDFTVSQSDDSQIIPADDTRTVNVTYTPTTRGETMAELEIRYGNSGQSPLTIGVNGTGKAPELSLANKPSELQAAPGDTDNTSLRVENTGNTYLNASLQAAPPFNVTQQTINVSKENSTTVTIKFEPNGTTKRSPVGTLRITPDSPAIPERTIRLAGTVEQSSLQVIPTRVNFGNITADSDTTRQVTIINTGTTAIDDLELNATGPFKLDSSTPKTIDLDATGIGSTSRLTLESNLSMTGPTSGTFLINGTTSQENASVRLDATRVAPNLTVETDPVRFSAVENRRTTSQVPLKNTGGAPLRVEFAGAFNHTEQDAGFELGGTSTSLRIPSGQTAVVPVELTPPTATDSTATLSITTNDPQASAAEENITLTATVNAEGEVDLTAPGSRNFGTVGLGDVSNSSLTVTNDGDRNVTITDSSLTGETAAFDVNASEDLTQTNITLASGEEVTFNTTYEPTTETTQTATVEITGRTEDETVSTSTVLVGSGQAAQIGGTQRRVRFGAVETDNFEPGSITIPATGPPGASVTVTPSGVSEDSPFNVTNDSVSVSGGQAETLDIRFEPEPGETGRFSETLRLQATSGHQTVNRTVRLTGTGTGPEATLATEKLNIGSISIDETRNQTVDLKNTGGTAFSVDVSESNEATDEPVSVAEIRGDGRLVPGEEQAVVLTIEPDEAEDVGSLDANVELTASDSRVNDTLRVKGDVRAPETQIEPSGSMTFSNTSTGSATQQTVTLNNTGNATLRVDAPTTNGANASAFSVVSGAQQFQVPDGRIIESQKDITLSFAPSSAGLKRANLTITPLNDPNTESQNITLTGTGEEASLGLSPTNISFGDVAQDSTQSREVTIENDGGAAISITNIEPQTSDFIINGISDGVTIDGQSERTFDVTVDPPNNTRGSISDMLKIYTNASGELVTGTLAARSVAPSLAETNTATNFDVTRLGTTTTETVVIENDGNAPLPLETASISGANSSAFSVVATPPNQMLPPGTSGRYTVAFDPSAVQSPVTNAKGTLEERKAEATLTVESPNVSENFEATLEGEAATPAFELDQRTVGFPETNLGETLTRNVTISNTPAGSAPFNVTGLRITGEDSQAYEATLNGTRLADSPVSLEPGDSEEIRITLNPTTTGAKYATLSVETNDTRQPIKKIGLSNADTTYSVDYGSVNVTYFDPTAGSEPTVDVDNGFQDRNATVTAVDGTVNTSAEQYSLDYTFHSAATDAGYEPLERSSAVQYINATTTATPENFSNSTIEIAVSKTALEREGIDEPQNITVYHEDTDSSGYETLDTELLFETRQGYVYEVTTDSYSLFAVAELSQKEDTKEKEKEEDEDGGSSGGGGGGGGGGGSGGGSPSDSSPPTIEEVKSTLNLVPPTATSETEIVDSENDLSGVTVSPSQTGFVSQIIFENEDASGTVEITEYDNPPQTAAEDVVSSVADDVESIQSEGSEATASSNDVSVVSIADISPTEDTAADSPATVSLSVDRDAVDDPNQLTVYKEVYNFDAQAFEWQAQETSVEETSEDEITLTVSVDEFSLFAITEIDGRSTESGQQETGEESNQSAQNNTFIIVLLLTTVVVIIAGVAYYRN